ncbi:MAG TPA: hypothetical protein VEK33_19690 [Terriglobales bacterium]|nr:hypothetical protein [Terriglobales bacterium]
MSHYGGTIFLTLLSLGAGLLWTYVYSPGMPLAARLCAGACTGFAGVATIGFILALWLGLNRSLLWISSGVIVFPSFLVLLQYRAEIRREFAETAQAIRQATRGSRRTTAAYVAFYAAVALVVGLVFAKVMFHRPDGIYTGLLNNLGDLPFHLQIISSFAHSQNFPPEDPGYANVRFVYPFLADFLSAMFLQAGASLTVAMWVPNFALAMALVGLMHYWTLELTRDRLAGVIAPVLILWGGGLGWWLLFRDVRGSDSGIVDLLWHLPRDYTIAGDTIWRWGNPLTALFVPQRSILFGVPIAIVIFTLWWQALTSTGDSRLRLESGRANQPRQTPDQSPPTEGDSHPSFFVQGAVRRMIAAGVLAGMLPLIHAHSFIVVMGTAGCLTLLFWQWRAWLAFMVPALIIALPEMIWSVHGSAVHMQTFLGWHPGWDRGNANVLWFWFVNTGAFIPLLIVAILWGEHGDDELVPGPLLRFYLPFTLCFIVPNLVKLAPWDWDNIKVLFYWYVASAPLVAHLLSSWFRRPAKWRWAAAGLLVSLTLAGTLEIVRVLSGTEANREFDADGIAMAGQILTQTEPRSLVLHAPTYNPPVFLTGRRSLLGYTGAVWSRGLEYGPREDSIRQIYAGSPQAASLMQGYHVDYVLVSPLERANLKVNDGFWSHFRVVARSGDYCLYKVGLPR